MLTVICVSSSAHLHHMFVSLQLTEVSDYSLLFYVGSISAHLHNYSLFLYTMILFSPIHPHVLFSILLLIPPSPLDCSLLPRDPR
jgi:hypothetical protein